MKKTLSTVIPTLSLALVAFAPFVRGQDMNQDSSSAPSAPPAANADATPPSNADQTPPPPRKGKGRMNPIGMALSKVSGLTDDQKAKAREIGQNMREQIQNLSDDERREKAPQLMRDAVQQVRALLNPDQQAQFDKALAQMRNGMKKKKKAEGDDSGPPPPPPPSSQN